MEESRYHRFARTCCSPRRRPARPPSPAAVALRARRRPYHAALRHRLATTPTTTTMASPSPSPPAANNNAAPGRRVPPPCWTTDETLALARAYTARRLAVGREHLTSADWAAVAAAAPSKTARQCRHKVEKLRRRLRSSRRRPCPLLDAIDLLDGPSPPPFASRAHSPSPSLSPSPPPAVSPPYAPSPTSASPPRKRRRDDEDGGVNDVVGALRAIGEGFLRAEERRMEAARETQRMRMEMALRHLDAQRRLMEAFVGRIVDALD